MNYPYSVFSIRHSIKPSGFTLVELLIVLVIVSILFGIGYANYRDFSRRQSLVSAARQMEADARLAQEMALSGKKPAAGCVVLDGYKFKLLSATNSYQISAYCQLDMDVVPKTLPAGITFTFTPPPPDDSVIFKTLGHGTNLTANLAIILSLTNTNYQVVLTITPAGEISYKPI